MGTVRRASIYVVDVALDPIVSLSVALAEAPGSVALFLGSGVSLDAGIPTGWDIYVDGVQRLRRLEEGDVEPLEAGAIDSWLSDTGRGDFNYSRLLEEIVPDQTTRRAYIAGHFADARPGATHEHVADLVGRGLVRVVVTTNFDCMLEQALAGRGIDPVVVSDDASLAAMPRREHVECFLLKVHGDYQQETIRNTPGELAELEPGIAAELQAILDRYDIVLVGYSGNDEAIRRGLRARRSRYGLWWLSRGDPPRPPIPELLERTAGRAIIRPSASGFFADLKGRIAIYEQHPSGHTPATVHDEILALLRTGDQVGLTEALRREHHAYDSALTDWTRPMRPAATPSLPSKQPYRTSSPCSNGDWPRSCPWRCMTRCGLRAPCGRSREPWSHASFMVSGTTTPAGLLENRLHSGRNPDPPRTLARGIVHRNDHDKRRA